LLDLVQIPPAELFAFLAAIAFAAGLNVYATVAFLGLLGRFGHMPLPSGLHVLENWMVIGASSALFFIEFFADKVPAFDLIWNALHTFVRVPAAALIAYEATKPLSNIGLSLGEDVLAVGLAWLATRHPYIAATLVGVFVLIIVALTRWVVRALRALFRGAERELTA
jgi:hypothetical protein